MRPFLRYATISCLFLVLAGSDVVQASPPGFVEGRLVVIEPEKTPGPPNAVEFYQKYPLVILSEDGQTQIARVTAGDGGAYRVTLPPGAYILDVQDRVPRQIRVRPQPFVVRSNQTVRVNMLISE